MAPRHRMARVEDVHELAGAMPHVTAAAGPSENPVYQVGGKSFVFFRNPRPDAVDPDTGDRYPDVIVFWVADEAEKRALVDDAAGPFFTTAHFDGHPSVLVRAGRLGEPLATNSPKSSRTRGSRARRSAGRKPGCSNTVCPMSSIGADASMLTPHAVPRCSAIFRLGRLASWTASNRTRTPTNARR